MPMYDPCYCPAPKSAWSPTVPPMKLMIPFELKSTGAAEMSLFQGLSSGNGRNPFRLAPWPLEIPLQLALSGGRRGCLAGPGFCCGAMLPVQPATNANTRTASVQSGAVAGALVLLLNVLESLLPEDTCCSPTCTSSTLNRQERRIQLNCSPVSGQVRLRASRCTRSGRDPNCRREKPGRVEGSLTACACKRTLSASRGS